MSTFRGAVGAERHHDPVVEHAQQLHLGARGDGLDLVEQQRAARGADQRPSRSASAPVKAPFAWPKSSLSSMLSGSAPAFTGTNGPRDRALWAWMARATSSLPDPRLARR